MSVHEAVGHAAVSQRSIRLVESKCASSVAGDAVSAATSTICAVRSSFENSSVALKDVVLHSVPTLLLEIIEILLEQALNGVRPFSLTQFRCAIDKKRCSLSVNVVLQWWSRTRYRDVRSGELVTHPSRSAAGHPRAGHDATGLRLAPRRYSAGAGRRRTASGASHRMRRPTTFLDQARTGRPAGPSRAVGLGEPRSTALSRRCDYTHLCEMPAHR